MSQVILSHCFYCGLPVNLLEDDFCPHCHYPASAAKEEAYLASALASLQQAMSYGGAQLRVVDLFQRYQNRLRMLQRQKAPVAPPFMAPANAPQVAIAPIEMAASVPLMASATRKVGVAAPPVAAKPPQPRRVFS